MSASAQPRVIIVGAGFGGIAAAIELRGQGFADVTILDKAPGIGGTWLHNTYPGAACDVPSHFYSFSYAQRRDWTRLCSPQPEILSYLRGVARDHGVDSLVVAGVEVTACRYDDAKQCWRVEAADGRHWEAEALIIATGQLHRPVTPRIEGSETFAGHAFHSAQWDHDYDLRGKRVAVIGTGASAVQFVPEIVEQVQRLVVFQRTGNWFMPRRNRAYPRLIAAAIRYVPGLQSFRRGFFFRYGEFLTRMIRHPRTFGRIGALRSAAFMRSQLKDPDLRRRLWPDYRFGCKRVLFSSAFLPALQEPNVEVVTDVIKGMARDGVVSGQGRLHEVDCVIYGTGFATTRFMFPMEVTGTGGRALADVWAEGAHAHLGMTVPGFPSLFVMYGPNTNTSGGSIITYLEAQAGYIRQPWASCVPAARRRSTFAPRSRRPATATPRRASRARPGWSATRGTGPPTGGSSPTGRATWPSTWSRPRSWTRRTSRSPSGGPLAQQLMSGCPAGLQRRWPAVQLLAPVAGHDVGVQLERELGGVGVAAELSALLRGSRLLLEEGEPTRPGLRDRIAHRARAVIELQGGRGQKAAAGEDLALEIGEPGVDHGAQSLEARRPPGRRCPDLLGEAVERRAQRGELKLFLRAEWADHAALAEAQLGGQAPDADRLETLGGAQLDRPVDDGGAGPGGLGLGAARHADDDSARSYAITPWSPRRRPESERSNE